LPSACIFTGTGSGCGPHAPLILEQKHTNMAKESTVKLDGTVVEVLPNTLFRIKLETEQVVLGYISGKMRQNEIKILMGDPVELEFSPYDMSRGRIVKRK